MPSWAEGKDCTIPAPPNAVSSLPLHQSGTLLVSGFTEISAIRRQRLNACPIPKHTRAKPAPSAALQTGLRDARTAQNCPASLTFTRTPCTHQSHILTSHNFSECPPTSKEQSPELQVTPRLPHQHSTHRCITVTPLCAALHQRAEQSCTSTVTVCWLESFHRTTFG